MRWHPLLQMKFYLRRTREENLLRSVLKLVKMIKLAALALSRKSTAKLLQNVFTLTSSTMPMACAKTAIIARDGRNLLRNANTIQGHFMLKVSAKIATLVSITKGREPLKKLMMIISIQMKKERSKITFILIND